MTQQLLYSEMANYVKGDACEPGCDYFLVLDHGDIKYYTPNDEDWGAIVAISEESHLAADTGFFDIDDMEDKESEYAYVVHNNKLMCRFELPDDFYPPHNKC